MKKLDVKKEKIDQAEEAVRALSDVDFGNAAAVDVQLDAVTSAFMDLMSRKKEKSEAPTLANVLSDFVENDIISPSAVNLADEIENLVETKDYEGYSEEYLREALEELIGNLEGELEKAIEHLRSAVH